MWTSGFAGSTGSVIAVMVPSASRWCMAAIRTHVRAQVERGVLHPQRTADALGQHRAQALARDALHDLAGPIDVGPVLPAVAGVEQQWRGDGRARAGDDARLAVPLREPVVLLV